MPLVVGSPVASFSWAPLRALFRRDRSICAPSFRGDHPPTAVGAHPLFETVPHIWKAVCVRSPRCHIGWRSRFDSRGRVWVCDLGATESHATPGSRPRRWRWRNERSA
jgi:hypothetical protein